ncbi:MAG: hypothetical protein FWG90_00260 [Oscillospiraceae bacterium]|nr:hypothetical protein [Oscillospiraceae bacterium]
MIKAKTQAIEWGTLTMTNNMNTERIIESAAKKVGLGYPLDDNTREFSESFLKSFDNTMAWMRGELPPQEKDIHQWLEELQRKADET